MFIDEVLNIEKSLNDIFNKSIYNKNQDLIQLIERGYVYSKIEKHKVLFVGMNPSYVDGSEPYDHKYYKIQDAVISYPKHYGNFQKIATNCELGTNWTYMDLFYFRETDQKKVDSLISDVEGIDFVCKQLKLSFSMIENLKPDLIVVCNSGGRKFFGLDKQLHGVKTTNVWLGYNFEFNDKFGVDVITGIHEDSLIDGDKHTHLIGTPILFSSTLTYMDASSKKRLEWQVKQILKYHTLFFGSESILSHRSIPIANQLKVLTERIKEIELLKKSLLSKNKHEEVARIRDGELDELEKIIELLMKIEN